MFLMGNGSGVGVKHSTIVAPLRRYEALAFIVDQIARTGICPTQDEIAISLGVSKARVKELIGELIAEGLLEKTPGGVRSLRVRDVARARQVLELALRHLGYAAAVPMGPLLPPFPDGQLPRLPEIRHLPDE